MRHRGTTIFVTVALILISAICAYASETITYGYDDTGRVTSVEYGDGTVIDYVYDGNGNRLTKATTLSEK